MAERTHPSFFVNSAAPIRICDLGGWTDTWFAGHGQLLNLAVAPHVNVQIAAAPAAGSGQVILDVENYGDRYALVPGTRPGKHPLLEAAVEYMPIPPGWDFEITVFSEAPAGASTGTSSAVAVALLGALDRLTPGEMTPHEIAYAAHRIETEFLQQQSGVQDQLAAAYGGINFIEMHAYPEAVVSPVKLPEPILWELERRLLLVYMGQGHHSSAVHVQVIRALEGAGPDSPRLEDLRRTAAPARAALSTGDFAAFGAAMTANTEAQGRLHSELINADARQMIEIGRAHAALGWKVNGAGGPGGSLTFLCADAAATRLSLAQAIERADTRYKVIPIHLSRDGLRVWKTEPSA